MIKTVNLLEQRLEDVTEHMDIAVIGCVVNGPGEAKEADLGVAGGSPNLFYVDGKPSHKVDANAIADEMERQVRAKIALRRELGLTENDTSRVIPIKSV